MQAITDSQTGTTHKREGYVFMTRPNILLLTALGSVLVFSGCGKEVNDTAKTNETVITEASLAADSTSLTFKLAEKSEKSKSSAPPEIIAVGQRFRDAQSASGILGTALNIGDKAPSFSLVNAVGETVNSEDLLAKGPIVLTFYRGHW